MRLFKSSSHISASDENFGVFVYILILLKSIDVLMCSLVILIRHQLADQKIILKTLIFMLIRSVFGQKELLHFLNLRLLCIQ